MPLLCGEGEKAFTRLREEIFKNSDDQSIFAWNYEDGLPKFRSDLSKYEILGILARHLSTFKGAGDFEPLPTQREHTMTSEGL